MEQIVRSKVLIVDDNDELRALVAMLLDVEGFEAVTAGNGKEALEACALFHPDLILLDMRMPVMNGWEFARALRDRDEDPPPIVVFTAAEDCARRAAEVQAVGMIGKPFEIEGLVTIIRRHLPP